MKINRITEELSIADLAAELISAIEDYLEKYATFQSEYPEGGTAGVCG